MISRQTVAIASTLALTTAMGGCAVRGPQVPPGSSLVVQLPPAGSHAVADPPRVVAGGLVAPSMANYVQLVSVQALFARTDANLAPPEARPTLAQLRQLIPSQLAGEQAARILLRVPASIVRIPFSSDQPAVVESAAMGDSGLRPSDAQSIGTRPSRFHGGGGRMGSGGGSMPMGRGSTYRNRMNTGPASRGRPIERNLGPIWRGRSVGVRVGGRVGPVVAEPDWGPDGGGLLPFPGGLLPFSFYPFAYDGFLFLVPFALAEGLWYPFFLPFYLAGGALAPYPGFLPPGPYGGPGPGWGAPATLPTPQ